MPPGFVDLIDAGCVGDGITDDYVAFTAAIATGANLYSSPAKAYRVTGTLTALAGTAWTMYGSTVVRDASMTGNTPTVHLPGNVILEDCKVNGSRDNGAKGYGIKLSGGGNVARRCVSFNLWNNGFLVSSGAAHLEDCAASDIDDGGSSGSANGFCLVGAATVVRCYAEKCSRAGIMMFAGSQGSVIDARTWRCGYGLQAYRVIGSPHVKSVVASDSNVNGILIRESVGMNIETVMSADAGLTAHNPSASGLYVLTSSRISVGRVVALRSPGYGVAIAGGSSDNTLDSVLVDGLGGWDSDPAIHLSGGSCRNTIGAATVRNATFAVILGEGIGGSNDDNHVGSLSAYAVSHGVVRNDAGTLTVGSLVTRR